MARIQVLPLTTESIGALSATPFVLVIDQVGDEDTSVYLGIDKAVGARAVLIVQDELTVANVDEELHDAARVAVERALFAQDQDLRDIQSSANAAATAVYQHERAH